MLDVSSRYVVGWMVAHRESATLAVQFIRETCGRQGIARDHLTIHADRGTAMTSKSVAFLLADVGVTKTHSRPPPSARANHNFADVSDGAFYHDFVDFLVDNGITTGCGSGVYCGRPAPAP